MGEIIRRVKDGRFLGFYLRYVDSDGKRKQKASHQPTREAARRMLVEIEARVARGLAGIAEPVAPSLTVAQLVERFLIEYRRPAIKCMTNYRLFAATRLRRSLPHIGHRPADAVTPAELAKMRDTLGETLSPASVKDSLAYLATAYSWALKLKLVGSNPMVGLERPTAASSVEFFSQVEVLNILRTAQKRAESGKLLDIALVACLRLALHAGLRKGELLGLRWMDLDLDAQRLTVARSYKGLPKSGKPRYLRLPSACIPALRSWRAVCPFSKEGQVFPPLPGWAHSTKAMLGLPALLIAAGVRQPAHPWHACRHTFASHYVMAGGNILVLQRILGHSDVKMTMIYAHLAPDFLGDEMERVQFD